MAKRTEVHYHHNEPFFEGEPGALCGAVFSVWPPPNSFYGSKDRVTCCACRSILAARERRRRRKLRRLKRRGPFFLSGPGLLARPLPMPGLHDPGINLVYIPFS